MVRRTRLLKSLKDNKTVHLSRVRRLKEEVMRDWDRFSHSQRVEWIKKHRGHFSTLGVLSTAEIPVIAGLSTRTFLGLLAGLGLAAIPLGIGRAMPLRKKVAIKRKV